MTWNWLGLLIRLLVRVWLFTSRDDFVYFIIFIGFHFPAKKFFERKKFNSVVGVFFLFLKLPITRKVHATELVSCLIQFSVVTADRKLEVAGPNPAIDHVFYVFLDTHQRVTIFQQQKLGFFRQNFNVFW